MYGNIIVGRISEGTISLDRREHRQRGNDIKMDFKGTDSDTVHWI
jgi:hypothetical protein